MSAEWILREEGYSAELVTRYGDKFLLGNGAMGYRGTLDEHTARENVALNLAGIYDRAAPGLWRETVNAPNPLFAALQRGGKSLSDEEISAHFWELDCRHGILTRETEYRTGVTVRSERFLDWVREDCLASVWSLSSEEGGAFEAEAGIDGRVWDINGPHLGEMRFSQDGGILCCSAWTAERGIPVNVRLSLRTGECSNCRCCSRIEVREGGIFLVYTVTGGPHMKFELVRQASVSTGENSESRLEEALALGYEGQKRLHCLAWERRWEVADVQLEGDARAQFALRYSIYHLLLLAPRRAGSIAARGLSGQTYKGAVFWDTEVFLLPFFLAADPDTAKRLIRYRIDTLGAARRKARRYGCRGAFYAWESQETGEDACSDFNVTDVFTGRPVRTYFKDKQIHISADVALGVARYVEQTGDEALLLDGGLEVLLECARFFERWAYFKPSKDRFELLDVVGPDEYHERVHNNAFTNYLAGETAETALRTLDILYSRHPERVEEICAAIGFDRSTELREFSEKLYRPEPDKRGILEQFDGYFGLEDVTAERVRDRLRDQNEYWGGSNGIATPTRVIKQADVVALTELLPERFTKRVRLANYEFYRPYTEHGSSLSACMYALAACRIGRPEEGLEFFRKTSEIDLEGGGKQYAGTVYIGGTHPAANGGAWMTAVMGFCGWGLRKGKWSARPCLPSGVAYAVFCAYERGRLFRYTVTPEGVKREERG